MSFILTSAIASALTDEVIAHSLAMMDDTNFREHKRTQANDNLAKEKPNYSMLPAGDALIAGTIGYSLTAHADSLAESLSGKINMDTLLSGSDFKKPSFVTAMRDMGNTIPSISPSASFNARAFDRMPVAA